MSCFRWRERDEHDADDHENSHADEFSPFDHMPPAWVPIRAACARLDQAVKAIKLRLVEGLRTAKSRKTPSVTYRLSIMERAGSCRMNIAMG